MDDSKLLNNRYEILEQIGEGGFGETLLAKDTQMPSYRYCVIKQLKPVTDDPETYELIQERFQREAATLEQLGTYHQQIPTLYAYFQENHYFYLIQEWIEGETLSEYCQKNGGIDEKKLRKILSSLLSVLEYIHEKEIVHRDIKPDNIMLRQGSLEPVLLDFGAVKETMGTVMTSSHRPTHSMVVGTPGFMPSEQAVGRPVYNSDLYALGLVGIYALTGKTPAEFATDMATGNLLWRSDASEISSELAEVLDCVIQSHPRDRYGSAKEMRLALEGASPQQNIPATVLSSAPQVSSQPATQISQPPAVPQGNSQPATQISQPPMNPSSYPASYTGNTSQGGSEWQKALIQGLVMGISMIVAVVAGTSFVISQGGLEELVNSSESSDDEVADSSSEPESSDDEVADSSNQATTETDPSPEDMPPPPEQPEQPSRSENDRNRREANVSLGYQYSCGSPSGSGSRWWPVRGSSNALNVVKNRYCGDALIINGQTQAASFTSPVEAQIFAQKLSQETGHSFWVGSPNNR